jgi:hypothetical protein
LTNIGAVVAFFVQDQILIVSTLLYHHDHTGSRRVVTDYGGVKVVEKKSVKTTVTVKNGVKYTDIKWG